jgi:hypothetical protein
MYVCFDLGQLVYVHACMYVRMCVCVCVCVYVCVYDIISKEGRMTDESVDIDLGQLVYVCMYVCMYVCIILYVCMCVYDKRKHTHVLQFLA